MFTQERQPIFHEVRYLRRDPSSADRKRMAYVAVAAKMARVAHGIIKPEPTSAASMKQRRQVEEPLRTGRRGHQDLVDNDPAFHLVEFILRTVETAPTARSRVAMV